MKKYKHIVVYSIVVILLSVLIFFILLNRFFASNATKEFNDANLKIRDLNKIYAEMNLPIRVFDNIFSQVKQGDLIEQEKNEKLFKAYTVNRMKFMNESKVLEGLSRSILYDIEHFPAYSILHKWDYFRVLETYANEVNTLSTSLEVRSRAELLEEIQLIDLDVSQLSQDYAALGPKIEVLNDQFYQSASQMRNKYILLINMILVVLLFAVFILAAFLFKLLGQDMNFIIKGYELLNRHEYKEEMLPKVRPFLKVEKAIRKMVTETIEEQSFLQEVKELTSDGYIIDDVLESLFHSIKKRLRTDRVGVSFVDYHKSKIIAEYSISNTNHILLGPGFEVEFKNTSLSKILQTQEPKINHDLCAQLVERPSSASLELLVKEGMKSNMIFPLMMNQNVFAFLFLSSVHKDNYDQHALQVGKNIASEIAVLLDKAYLAKTMFSKMTGAFAELVDQKDNETGEHIMRMVQYSTLLAQALIGHCDPDYLASARFVKDIENNASVHDIGKVGIPDEILKKPGKLTPEEWVIMRTHSNIGGDIFASLKDSLQIFNRNFYQIAENIARYHHERWDGSGYPEGLCGKAIPLEARIVAIADVLDALTSKRVYKSAFGFEESIEIIRQSAGSHLDPELVRILIAQLAPFKAIYEQRKVYKELDFIDL